MASRTSTYLEQSEPIRCFTFAKAERRTRTIEFCYLCGNALPVKGTRERKDLVNTEHIIPAKLLGKSQSDSAWSPRLPVHIKCHKEKNDQGDDFAILFHRIQSQVDKPFPPQAKSLGLGTRFDYEMINGILAPRYAYTNAGKIRHAAMNWARGMHAFLYNQYLPMPNDEMSVGIMTPGAEEINGLSVEKTEKAKSFFKRIYRFSR